MLDKDLVAKIKNLKLEYKSKPQPELLIAIPSEEGSYIVTHETEEFTSLCPLNVSQPDHARIVIEFEPDSHLVELKSLKLYLVSFRMVQIFHEQVPSVILKDIGELIEPKWMRVTGFFTVRGGLQTTVVAEK